jgi:hypothetical protein
LCAYLCWTLTPACGAQETNGVVSKASATNNPAAKPAQASTNKWSGPDTWDGFDWIELTSGEWLKGEIKSMLKDKLEFDSDKLGLLTLDWDDVRQVKTPHTETVRTVGMRQYTGSLYINEKRVEVTDAKGMTTTFNRSELMGLIRGGAREINYWSFKLGAGATYQTGNTRQTDMNVTARIQRRTAGNRLGLSYLGVYTASDGVETADNQRVNGSFDMFLTHRLFVRPVSGEYYQDKFQNIQHQGTAGVAMGYTLIDNNKTEWDIYGGPGYRYTKFYSVPPGESSEESTPAFLAGTTWDRELTDSLDANATYNFGVMNERSGTYTHQATAGLSINLTSNLDLDLTLVWVHVQTPQPTSDGSIPLPNDFRFLVGVSVDL